MSTPIERVRELRARRRTAGLRTDGKPRVRPTPAPTPPREHVYGMSAESAKALGVESIGWLAEARPRYGAYYRGLQARAARLPASWWLSRMHWTIATLVTAVERALPLSAPDLTIKN